MSLNDNKYHVKSGIETEQHFSINTKHRVNILLLEFNNFYSSKKLISDE